MTIIALPWPWSVPRLPFSSTARPNSDIVRTTVSVHAIAEVGDERRDAARESRRGAFAS